MCRRRRDALVCDVTDDVTAVSLLLPASGGVSSSSVVDGVRPSYVLAGAVGWTNTASHVIYM